MHHQGNRYLNSKNKNKTPRKTINVLLCVFFSRINRRFGPLAEQRIDAKLICHLCHDVFIQFDVSIHRALVWQHYKQNNCQRSIAETFIDWCLMSGFCCDETRPFSFSFFFVSYSNGVQPNGRYSANEEKLKILVFFTLPKNPNNNYQFLERNECNTRNK